MSDQPQKESTAMGIVSEALPNTSFKVLVNKGGDEQQVHAYLSGKMRMNRIKVLVGDRVEVVLDMNGTKGRIVKRM